MAREAIVKIRTTESEKLAFQEAADIAGISLSAWTRERLRKAAIRELEAANRQIAFFRQQTSDTE